MQPVGPAIGPAAQIPVGAAGESSLSKKRSAVMFLVTNHARYIDGLIVALATLPASIWQTSDIILFHSDINASVIADFRAIQPDVILHSVQGLFRQDTALHHPSIQNEAVVDLRKPPWLEVREAALRGERHVDPFVRKHVSIDEFAGGSCPMQGNQYWFWPLDYIHGCYFWAYKVFTLDIVHRYDYVARFDADLEFKRIPCDPFEVLRRGDYDFGYYYQEFESHPSCFSHVRETSELYAMMHRLPTSDLVRLHPSMTYHGAFVFFKVAFWKDPKVLHYLQFMVDTGGSWRHRWGDSFLWTPALALFSAPKRIKQFSGFRYEHNNDAKLWRRTDQTCDPECEGARCPVLGVHTLVQCKSFDASGPLPLGCVDMRAETTSFVLPPSVAALPLAVPFALRPCRCHCRRSHLSFPKPHPRR